MVPYPRVQETTLQHMHVPLPGASRAGVTHYIQRLPAQQCPSAYKMALDTATQEHSSKLLAEVARAYSYVALWMSISIAVIMFNKWLLAFANFPFPLSLTLWHMVFCSSVGFLAIRVFKVADSHNMPVQDYLQRVLPIGLLYAGSLWLANSAYLYLSVSFIQMTKSLMPGLVYAAGIMMGTETYAHGHALNMLLIAFGVVVCAWGEVNLVVKGLVQQLAALVFEALRLTMVQVLITSKGLAMNPIQSLYYISPACLLCLLPPFLLKELPEMLRRQDWEFHPTIMVANAVTALLLNLAVFLLIGKTSALTMNIAGVIKDWMLIFFSYAVFKAPLTLLNLGGYVFCCAGVVVYNHMKFKALQQRVASTASKGQDNEAGTKEDGDSKVHRPTGAVEVLVMSTSRSCSDAEEAMPLIAGSNGSQRK